MGKTDREKGTRLCGKCGIERPLTIEFFHRSVPQHGGFMHYCKTCEHDRRRDRMLRPYGLTPQTYAARLAAQGGVCAICKTPPRDDLALAVDHDHADGGVRKLLCRRCNQALGHAHDAPELLRALATYLESGTQFVPPEQVAKAKRTSRYVLAPIVDGKRACSGCGVPYPLAEEFYYRVASYPGGFAYACKPCARESARWRNMLRLYGLTREAYEALLDSQGGGCGVCGKPPTGGRVPSGGGALLDVDHHHAAGHVRGLLCRRCNLVLGHVGEDVALLWGLADYLEAHART